MLGRILGDELGATDGRDGMPPEGRGAALEPREPWLDDGRGEDPCEEGADEPLEPRCGSAKAGRAEPSKSRDRPTRERKRVFMITPIGLVRTRWLSKSSAQGTEAVREGHL